MTLTALLWTVGVCCLCFWAGFLLCARLHRNTLDTASEALDEAKESLTARRDGLVARASTSESQEPPPAGPRRRIVRAPDGSVNLLL